MDLPAVISDLAARRPVFHSEADFQHELAWEIHTKYAHQGVQLRLEYPLAKMLTIDILVHFQGKVYAIELKYKKERFAGTVSGEPFAFNRDSAHPLSRYDGWHDIDRVGRACTLGASCGYAVFLTNDSHYWRNEAVGGSRPFSLHEGRVVKAGKLTWPKTSPKYKEARPSAICIHKRMMLEWHGYSVIPNPATEFKYLLYCYEP